MSGRTIRTGGERSADAGSNRHRARAVIVAIAVAITVGACSAAAATPPATPPGSSAPRRQPLSLARARLGTGVVVAISD